MSASRSVPLTDQQSRAVATRDVSVVLSSGAGCGKTHVLTERYLAHLRDDGAEAGQIVAITFTDRAARQMRGRIRAAVVKHLQGAASDDEAATWARHLRGLETAPISTIHSLCGNLLRQFAFDAGLDPQFEVLEEVLAVNLRDEASEECLQKLLTARTEVADDLRELVLLYGWPVARNAIGSLLLTRDAASWQCWLDKSADEITDHWKREARDTFLPRYIHYLLAARPAIVRLVTLLEQSPPRPGPMADRVAAFFDGLNRLATATDVAADVAALVEAARVVGHGKKAWPDADVYEAIKNAMEKFRDTIRLLKLERFAAAEEAVDAAVVVGRRFLRVALAVAQAYQERKQTLALVDFQDLLVLARDLLRDRADVRARVQDRYRFVLIDELQDTDPVQMEFVEYLCGGMTAGKLFAVGDSKQSIYRFRGAEVRLFQQLRQRVAHDGRQHLSVNFRSQPDILHFVNALFARRLDDFEPLMAYEAQINPGPCVEFLWSPRADKSDATESRLVEADWIARRIAGLVAAGSEPLVVERNREPRRLRAVRPGDVVLLFRSMSNVHLYEAALRRYGLHYYLVGGRAFFAQQEIYDILNLLRALENPRDSVSLAGTLRSPFCCLSDEALFLLARHRDGLWTGLHDDFRCAALPAAQREPAARARRFLDRWRGLKDRLPIAELLNAVFADSGFDAAMRIESLGDRKLANLWKLLDLARTFDRSGLFGLAEFIDRLGDLVRSQPREEQAATEPENADVVRLMSIHQAKGLEFPVVFIPDFNAIHRDTMPSAAVWDPDLGCVARPPRDEDEPPFSDFAWSLCECRGQVENWHEELRTLYVACTRARDYLVLSAAVRPDSSGENEWMLALSERFNPVAGTCIAADVPNERKPLIRVFDELRPIPDAQPLHLEEVRPSLPPLPEWLRIGDTDPNDGMIAAEDLETESAIGAAPPARARRAARLLLTSPEFLLTDDWQAVLASYTAGMPAAEANVVGDIVSRFARSDLRKQMSGATALYAEMPFVFTTSARKSDVAAPFTIEGTIDCLWQDALEGWHLLGFVRDGDDPEAIRDQLVFAAAAMRGQFGKPRAIELFDLQTGESAREKTGRSSLTRLLTASLRRHGRS